MKNLCQTRLARGSLSHFDLKKYVKIKYRASDIILAILGFVIVSVLYYLGNFFRLVAGAVFVMLYAIIMNRRLLGIYFFR